MVCHGIKLVFSHHTHKPLGSSVYGKCCIASVCIFSGRIIAQPHDSCALSETGSVPADWQNCYVTTGVEAIPKIIAPCDAVNHETCFFLWCSLRFAIEIKLMWYCEIFLWNLETSRQHPISRCTCGKVEVGGAYKNHRVGNFRHKHKTIKCEVAGVGITIEYIHIS